MKGGEKKGNSGCGGHGEGGSILIYRWVGWRDEERGEGGGKSWGEVSV